MLPAELPGAGGGPEGGTADPEAAADEVTDGDGDCGVDREIGGGGVTFASVEETAVGAIGGGDGRVVARSAAATDVTGLTLA